MSDEPMTQQPLQGIQDDAGEKPHGAIKRRLAPDERRQQIIDAAISFFAEVGLEGRTRDLADRLGITQSLLYKYFDNKERLLEAVFQQVYLGRLRPEWRVLLRNRKLPLKQRMVEFYQAYSAAIFTYEWMRIFMFSGLAGDPLNNRYLTHLKEAFLSPLLEEMTFEARGPCQPEIEDIWNLHGGIVYLGIRRFVYQTPTPENVMKPIESAITRILSDFAIDH